MKEWLNRPYSLLIFPAAVLMVLAGGCDNMRSDDQEIIHEDHAHHTAEEVYTCPMHPEIKQNEPGICPICKMDLVLMGEDGKASGLELGQVLQPADKSVLAAVGTVTADSMTFKPLIEVHGKLDYDPRQLQSVSANFRGRIEKLFIRYNYQPVQKGQALFEIFSEELQNAQENYLFLLRKDATAGSLITSAEEKLKLLGMTTRQVQSLRNSGKVSPRITIYAPADGMIVEQGAAQAQTTPAEPGINSGAMGNMRAEERQGKQLSLVEGSYVGRGEKLFTILSTDKVWGILEVHGLDVSLVRKGQQVRLATSSGDSIYGNVDFIDPELAKGKNMQVRVFLNNKQGKLFVGDLLSGTIEAAPVNGLFLPSSAVVDLGEQKIVFVKEEEVFTVRQVKTALAVSGHMEVTHGLSQDEKVAANAAFLVDSESFIRTERK